MPNQCRNELLCDNENKLTVDFFYNMRNSATADQFEDLPRSDAFGKYVAI
jgi:hypothetical protein